MQEFFDGYAPHWDDGFDPDLPARSMIVELSGLRPGERVLDIACGTGAMFREILKKQPGRLVGLDLSPEMLKRAREKYGNRPEVELVCGDLLSYNNEEDFDRAILYNAYPHFLDRPALLKKVAALLKPGGRFTLAHSMGREALNRHHANIPAGIARDLEGAEEEASLWTEYFRVDGKLDLPDFYLITGTKK